MGCEACHLVEPGSTAVSSGPNLFGLMRTEPRMREVAEGEGHRFQIKAGREYLHRSVRTPAEQLAVAESGPTRGQAYLPVMPAFPKEMLSDRQIDAIGDYLATLNMPGERGPVVRLIDQTPAPPYDPMADSLQWLVGDEVRLQRGPLVGTSGRSVHVGNPNGIHYSFDPRLLAVVKIWQGGFLDMEGELVNRGNRGLALGYDSREIAFGEHEYLLAPLQRRPCPSTSPSRRASSATSPRSGKRSTAVKTSWRASPRWTRNSSGTRATRATSWPRPCFVTAWARTSSRHRRRFPPAASWKCA